MNAAAFFDRLAAHPADAVALVGSGGVSIDYGQLLQEVDDLGYALCCAGVRVLATQLDNGPAWVVADLAALGAGIVHVPLPAFFTAEQTAFALRAAGADALLTATAPAAAAGTPSVLPLSIAGSAATLSLLAAASSPAPAASASASPPPGTSKITFTSGTTGQPKGVCLSGEAMLAVAAGLRQALAPLGIERHLCALPLPVLLENIAGLYAPLLAGATTVVLPLAEVGLRGSSSFDPALLQQAVDRHAAHSVIALPQMLRLWTGWRARNSAAGRRGDDGLKLVAVGGAHVGASVLLQARACGLPAYEGYGLSEGASVQTLNLPGADRPGSAGRPLPHARLRIAADGEIEIGGSLMLGYLGAPASPRSWHPTGDLGVIDADGFLQLAGRKKNVLITGYGRNVSPEWVETALQSQPEIAQAVVCGDGEAALWAVLWPSPWSAATPDALAAAVRRANATLPDYAQIAHWVGATEPFSVTTGLATANGRPQRAAVLAHGRSLLARRTPSRTDSLSTTAPMADHDTRPRFFDRLKAETAGDRLQLIGAPIIQGAMRGEVSIPSYLAFLTEAYHHVRHTVPLLIACRDRLPARLDWLRPAMDEYVEEEQGHDEWILDDIAAAGGDREAARHGTPSPATEVMVAYAYDTIARGNPVGFLGMVHVLEGTSVDLALAAADRIQGGLRLPDNAFSYLRSHGTLDREHTAHFEQLVNALEDEGDRAAIVHAARMFYRLYGDVFRGLPLPQRQQEAA